MVRCQSCGRMNPDGSTFCDRCGRALPEGPSLPESRTCPQCGASNEGTSSFCIRCGSTLPTLMTTSVASTGQTPAFDYQLNEKRSSTMGKPTWAAIFLIGAGILDTASAIRIFTTPLPVTDLPIDFSGLVAFCGGFELLMGLFAFIGAYVAFKRGSLVLTIVTIIMAMLGVGFLLGFILGLIALVLVALSTNEFD